MMIWQPMIERLNIIGYQNMALLHSGAYQLEGICGTRFISGFSDVFFSVNRVFAFF